MASLPSSSKRLSGKRCVAGGHNGASCGNSQYNPEVSIHHFPDKNKDPNRYFQWVRFVRRHRPNWSPTSNQAILCGIHFEESAFTVKRDIATSLGMKLKLKPDAVPTIDVANERKEIENVASTSREKRKVMVIFHFLFFLPHWNLKFTWSMWN